MQGFFDAKLKDARGLGDDAFKLPYAKLRMLLENLPTVQHAPWQHNLVNDNFSAWMFRFIMGGGSISNAYNRGTVGINGLATIALTTTDSEPAYTEGYDAYQALHAVTDYANNSSGSKRFIEDSAESELIAVADNQREELQFRSRFLYTPSQGNSSNIRSIGYYFRADADITSLQYTGIFGRVRLKDSGGTPIVINKTAAQVLLIQLTLKLATV